MKAIGLDVGHSAVKVSVGNSADERTMFPSAAAPAVELSFDPSAAMSARETVRLSDGKKMFIGETAVIQRGKDLFDGLTDDWVDTHEHAALLIGGHDRAIELGAREDAILVLGLPSKTFAEKKEELVKLAALQLQKPTKDIICIPQPYAALMETVLNEDGLPAVDFQDAGWVVIDVGFYTTDFGALECGRWRQEATASSDGVHRAARLVLDRLREKHGLDLSDIRKGERILRQKSYLYQGEVLDMSTEVEEISREFADDIIKHATKVFSSGILDEAASVLVVGGGANIVFDHLKKEWRHAKLPQNPRMCVAEGLRRFGVSQLG